MSGGTPATTSQAEQTAERLEAIAAALRDKLAPRISHLPPYLIREMLDDLAGLLNNEAAILTGRPLPYAGNPHPITRSQWYRPPDPHADERWQAKRNAADYGVP